MDLFEELVPVAVHQAMAAFDVRKTEIVNTEIMKLHNFLRGKLHRKLIVVTNKM